MVWWIALQAKDEQVQGKNNLLRRGVLELDELVWLGMIRVIYLQMSLSLSLDEPPSYGGG